MSRRTPFPFRDHHDPLVFESGLNDLIDVCIAEYEDALLVEYKSGDVDVASYHEGLRTAYEQVLVTILGIDQAVMDAYWDRGQAPAPAPPELPLLADPSNWLITYEQVEEWTGYRMNAEEWDALNEAIPHSSIPEAINTIVDTIKEK